MSISVYKVDARNPCRKPTYLTCIGASARLPSKQGLLRFSGSTKGAHQQEPKSNLAQKGCLARCAACRVWRSLSCLELRGQDPRDPRSTFARPTPWGLLRGWFAWERPSPNPSRPSWWQAVLTCSYQNNTAEPGLGAFSQMKVSYHVTHTLCMSIDHG